MPIPTPGPNSARISASHFVRVLRAGDESRDGPGLSPVRQVAAPGAALPACADGAPCRQAGSRSRESSEGRANS